MSKAFTREDDNAAERDLLPVARAPLPPGAQNYITPAGARELEQKLGVLLERKSSVLERPGGDPVEQRRLENQIRILQETLASIVITPPPATDREVVRFGATVTVVEANGEKDTYQIVGVDEADFELGRVSWMSPLARALMSRRAGEKVRFRTPAGEKELTILSVEYEPAQSASS